MGEIIQFPETVEEFMQQYKITDTQQVYTNGTELVPISRMKQWFEAHNAIDRVPAVDAVPVIRCKDCKFYNPGSYYIGCESAKGIIGPSDDDFCSYGERRRYRDRKNKELEVHE